MTKKVLIMGGNGYLGWPTAMSLSKTGYKVSLVDNDIKQKISVEEGITSLFPFLSLEEKFSFGKIKQTLNLTFLTQTYLNMINLKK